jgi:hypothetical protein
MDDVRFESWQGKEISLDFWTLEDGTDTLFQTSVNSYHTTLHNIPEEYRSEIGVYFVDFIVSSSSNGVEIDIGSLLSYKQEWILHRAFSAFPSP